MSAKRRAAMAVISAALAAMAEDAEERFPRTKAVFDRSGKHPRVTRTTLERAEETAEQERRAAARIAKRFIGD